MENQIRDLESKISVLEEENAMLADRAEDMTLMSMISDLSSALNDPTEILKQLLERIALLKDITFTTCCLIDNKFLLPITSYLQSADEDSFCEIQLDDQLITDLKDGSVYLEGTDIKQIKFCEKLKSLVKSFDEILIIPFHFKMDSPSVMLFANYSLDGQKILNRIILLLQQLCYQAENRINNIILLERLLEAKQKLEYGILEQTKDLKLKNTVLKSEIQKREKAEIELELSEEKFREIFNNANDAIILWLADENRRPTKFLDANNVFLKLTGYSKEEAAMLNPDDLSGSEKDESVSERMKLAKSKDTFRFEVPIRTKSGDEILTEASTRIFKLQDEVVILAVHRDITERKEFEMQILEEKTKAEEADQLKSFFLANMSHEIRTPMNAILGFSDLLVSKKLTEDERNTYLNIVHSKGQELMAIMNDILYLSKIEANQIQLLPEETQLLKFFEMAELNWQQMIQSAEKTEIRLEVNLKKLGKENVMIDHVRVSQVLNNLVSNAIKFTHAGSITIACASDDQKIFFSVEDEGIGIPISKQDLIWERFRQADEGNNRVFGGAGLGLAISKEIVELMEGEIGLESQPGKGSRFWFSIPLKLA